jgi:hypothetical protein
VRIHTAGLLQQYSVFAISIDELDRAREEAGLDFWEWFHSNTSATPPYRYLIKPGGITANLELHRDLHREMGFRRG